MSPLKLRLLIAIATQMRRIANTGDVSQAFCESVLSDDEQYAIRPPHGCPITPSNTYLLLKRLCMAFGAAHATGTTPAEPLSNPLVSKHVLPHHVSSPASSLKAKLHSFSASSSMTYFPSAQAVKLKKHSLKKFVYVLT